MFTSQFHDNTGYQENLLMKQQVELGNSVAMLSFDNSISHKVVYYNLDGVKVISLPSDFVNYPRKFKILTYLNLYKSHIKGTTDCLATLKPDVIFIHGLQSFDNIEVVKYAKNNHVRLYADNHNDFYNAHFEKFTQRFIHKTVFRYCAQRIASVATKIWGVTPWRVSFLKDVYGLRNEQIGLLVMGGDETFIKGKDRKEIRKCILQKYSIPWNAKIVVTGG